MATPKKPIGPDLGPPPQVIVEEVPERPSYLTKAQRDILRKGDMCRELTDDQFEYFWEVINQSRLNPFRGQITATLRNKKDGDDPEAKHKVLVLITNLAGLRGIGDRSGQHDGEEIQWSGKNGEWHDEWLADDPPVAARTKVFRKDRTRPSVHVCRWDAYCQFVYARDGKEIPNKFWKRMGSWMLAKCSCAGAYRAAYPNETEKLYLDEEVRDELDSDSEIGIDAEMARRAAAEKEFWDKEKAAGHYPAGEKPVEGAPVTKVEGDGLAAPSAPRQTKPAPVKEVGKHEKARIEVAEKARPTPKPSLSSQEAAKKPSETIDSQDPDDWRKFKILRISFFKGRTVESLTDGEIKGLSSWMEKVQASWGSMDNDIKAHYLAIAKRIEHDTQAALEEQTKENQEDAQSRLDDSLQSDLQFP